MMKETVLSHSVRVMFASSMAVGMSLMAQSVLAQEVIQRVEITGSSVKRVDSETALPVQVLSKQDIARTGATSTEDLLSSISSLSSSGSTVGATGSGNTTYGLSSISLRGLGSDRALILVNGRRLAAFAGGSGASVNVNAIPLAAIERIEVLKDGASGVYGSDAIAGVVNFILSRNFKGVEISGEYGSPTESGGGQNQKASIAGGFGDLEKDRYSVVLSASFEKEKTLYGRDRSYAKTANLPPYTTATATGQGNIEGALIPGAFPNDRVPGFGTSPGTGYGSPLAAANNCEGVQNVLSPTKTTKGAPYCAFDSAPFVALIPDKKLANFSGNVAFKINDDHQLFADALYSQTTVTNTIQASPVRRSFLVTDDQFAVQGVDPALILYPSNPAYQSIAVPYLTAQGGAAAALIGKPLAITSRVFDFGGRQTHDVADQSRLVVGAKGTVLKQDYEIAYSYNQSKVEGSVPSGYFSQVAYAKIINNPANNWNPWAPGGVQTGALADLLKTAQYSGSTLKSTSRSDIFDAKLTGDVFKIDDRSIQYAAGLQSRRESFNSQPSAALSAGDIAGLGGAVPPVDRNRTINSVFGELTIPILKSLEADIAIRNDNYNDVGASTNYKASARWQPSKSVLFRGSFGTGFRAPTLTDLYQPQTVGTSAGFNDPKTGQTNVQVNSLSGGNPNVTPEKSRQASLGVVLSPVKSFSIGVDAFKINVKDIIATPSAQEVVSGFRAGDPAYASLVTLSGNDIDSIKTILSNLGVAKLAGYDVFAAYRNNFSFGKLDVALNGTYFDKYDQTSAGGVLYHKVGTTVDRDGNPVIGADITGGVVLRWKHSLSATWTKGAWATTLVQNYRTGYEVGHDLNDNRVFIPSEEIYDLNVAYKGVKNLTISAGVKNLFDKGPSIYVPVSNQFQSGFDINQYDPRGRFAYISASYLFK
jgi:iron complex outermembrane receptor protein